MRVVLPQLIQHIPNHTILHIRQINTRRRRAIDGKHEINIKLTPGKLAQIVHYPVVRTRLVQVLLTRSVGHPANRLFQNRNLRGQVLLLDLQDDRQGFRVLHGSFHSVLRDLIPSG